MKYGLRRIENESCSVRGHYRALVCMKPIVMETKSTFEELKFPHDYLRVKAYQLCGSCNGNCETSPSPASQDDSNIARKMLHGSRNELTITAFIVGGCLLVYFTYHHIYKCTNKRTPQLQ